MKKKMLPKPPKLPKAPNFSKPKTFSFFKKSNKKSKKTIRTPRLPKIKAAEPIKVGQLPSLKSKLFKPIESVDIDINRYYAKEEEIRKKIEIMMSHN